MPLVTILPGNLQIEVATGETLAQAAWRQGYHWPTTCWEKCSAWYARRWSSAVKTR